MSSDSNTDTSDPPTRKTPRNTILQGDVHDLISCLETNSVDAIVTSPPYWGLRDYQADDQLGLEDHPWDYIDNLVSLIEGLRRVLKPSGNLLINLGDTYNTDSIVRPDSTGLKMTPEDDDYEKFHTAAGREEAGNHRRSPIPEITTRSKLLIPERIAIKLTENGWIAHNRLPWVKPTGGTDSATDRWRNRHEDWYYFSLDADDHYFGEPAYDVIEQTTATGGEHNAQYPVRLVKPLIERVCPPDGLVLDPFIGSGTTGVAAKKLNRDYLGIELREDYAHYAETRIEDTEPDGLTRWLND